MANVMEEAVSDMSCQSKRELFTVAALSTSHSFTWTINNIDLNCDLVIYEREFRIPNVDGDWAVEFEPPDEIDPGSLDLRLIRLTSPKIIYLQFHAYVLSAHKRRECGTRIEWPDTNFLVFRGTLPNSVSGSQSHRYHKFVSVEDLTSKSLIQDGALTIVFDIQVFNGIGLKVSDATEKQNPVTFINCQVFPKPLEQQRQPRVVDDLKAMYKDSRATDVRIRAGGREFMVHGVILMARSSVFRAMFQHDMKEKMDRRVEIDDLSADVVDAMLHFMYTDEIPNIDTMAEELLAAADKYDIPRLKAECQRQLTATLHVDNAAAMLTLADTHNANELQSASLCFITRNVGAVRKTEGWKSLSHESKDKLLNKLVDTIEQKKA